jgi:hypothetical protein
LSWPVPSWTRVVRADGSAPGIKGDLLGHDARQHSSCPTLGRRVGLVKLNVNFLADGWRLSQPVGIAAVHESRAGPVQTSASIAVTQHSTPNLDGTAFRQPLVGCFHRRAAASHHSGRPAFRRASAYIAGCFGCRYGPRTFWRALEIRTAGSIQSVSSLPHHAQLAAAIRNAASLPK